MFPQSNHALTKNRALLVLSRGKDTEKETVLIFLDFRRRQNEGREGRKSKRMRRKREVQALFTAGEHCTENAGDVHPGPSAGRIYEILEQRKKTMTIPDQNPRYPRNLAGSPPKNCHRVSPRGNRRCMKLTLVAVGY